MVQPSRRSVLMTRENYAAEEGPSRRSISLHGDEYVAQPISRSVDLNFSVEDVQETPLNLTIPAFNTESMVDSSNYQQNLMSQLFGESNVDQYPTFGSYFNDGMNSNLSTDELNIQNQPRRNPPRDRRPPRCGTGRHRNDC